MSNYRIIVSYSEQKNAFVARVPELEACEAEGETRAAALAALEEELEAQVANIQEQGGELPAPVDLEEFDGQLSIKVTPELHRDLVFQARMAKVELEQYLTELLARGIFGGFLGPQGGGQRRRRDAGRRRDGQQGGRYHDIMENRADFIEYVRRLEGGGGGRGGGGRGGRRGNR